MKPTQDILAEMKKVCDAASPPPWIWSNEFTSRMQDTAPSLLSDGGCGILSCDGEENGPHKDNAQFIAQSRTALPRLIEALSVALGTIEAQASAHNKICMNSKALAEINRILNGTNSKD